MKILKESETKETIGFVVIIFIFGEILIRGAPPLTGYAHGYAEER